jgi:hypothetical protein
MDIFHINPDDGGGGDLQNFGFELNIDTGRVL